MADDQLTIVKEEPLHVVGMVPDSPSQTTQKTWTAAIPLAASGAAAALPAIRDAAMAFGTSPTAAATGSSIANAAVTAGTVLKGLASGSPMTVLAAPGAGWAAGKGAFWLTKSGQSLARPIAGVLDSVAPYAKSLLTLGAAMGGAAVPMGIDLDSLGQSPEQQAKNPAPLRMLVNKVEDGVKSLMGYGLSREQAVTAIKEHVSKAVE